ncbi:MAG: hypothetical protein JWM12_3163, partial [Ilumatobacteraceae bacterium]|nr:hypothetical protein [Ilumatobacteraceae bacterium]
MSVHRRSTAAAEEQRADKGFTLIEVMIAVVLLTVITGAIAAAMITALNVASSTTAQVADSTDAGVISAYLLRDAQSAGATDPATGLRSTTFGRLGVTTDTTAATLTGCAQPAAFVARFSWIDPIERTSPVVVYYALDSTKGQLTRRICRSQTTVDLVVGNHLTSAVATCDTTCALSPASVSLALTGSGARAPFAYTLRASIRSDAQAPPTGGNSSPVPLLALGGGAAVACPNLTLSGTGPIKVIGNAFVDSSCGATPIAGAQGVLRPTGTTASIAGINDPFSGRTPPPDTCASGSSTVTGQGTDTLTQYAANVSIVADTVFQPGRYVFCNGLALTAGKITGTDVLLYVKAGTITVGAAATVDMAGRASGADTNLLIWVAGPDQTIQVDAGTRVSSLRGVIYAPTSTLQLSSTNAANVGGVVVENMTITGAGQARLGLPLPLTAIAPATIPSGEVGVVSASTAFSAAGGVAPYGNWSAAGLPAGMSIDATGTLSGTPTASGTFNVTVAVFDATAQATSMDYTLSIRPRPTVTGPAPANGQIGVAYAPTTQTASGGTTPYAWSATGLPAGVSIGAATGTIAGAPTESGTFTVIVTVTDAVGATATRSSTVTINAVPSISGPAVLPVGQLGAPYRPTTVTAAGGTAPYRWSATGLPSGLSIDASTGVLAGAPTIAGTFTAVVTVTDAVGATATATFTITINATPSIAGPATLPNGQVAIAYASTTVTVNDGTAPFSWMATGLPAGLTINASTGTVAGTPTASGTFTIAVSATDAVGATATKGYTIAINAAPTVSAPAALPAGQINVAYASTNVTGSGGTTPYAWTATGLPAGLSITIGGAVSGTATASGAFTVVATLTDAVGATATKSYTLTIKVAPSVAAPATLPAGQVNVAFTATTVTGSGGTTPYLWSATGMPSGISIAASSGVVSGAPTLSGTFTAVVTVTDAVGATATKSYTVTIKAAPTVTGPDLPSGQVSIVYTATTEIGSGGTTAYVWSATGLPTGLTIVSSTGIVSGTPTVAGSYAVVVKLTDAVGATATANYAVTIRASPSVATPATLPTGQISQVYSSTTLTGSGGTTPYSWSATGMPPGVTIAASTGVISGTPTASGTFTAVLKVTDAVAGTGTKTYTVTVNAAPSVTAPAALPAGQINVAYVAPTVTGSGGTTPYTWSATAAPTGVTIDPSTGVISGTPTASGAFTVVVRVTDAVAATATRSYTLTVKAAPAVAGPATLPSGKNGVAYTSTTVTVSGGTTPYAWSATGLPGLSIASATGVISGTPNATGSFTVVVSVVDANAQSASRTYTLAIADPVPVAVANSYTLNEDTTLTVAAAGVLANDTDPRGLPLTAVLVSGVANGALTFNADGGFTYVPRPTFNGAASFTYKANDGSFDSAVVTVSLTVTAIDDAPVNSVPGPQQTPKNTNLVFSSTNRNLISISDIDAAASLVQVKLNATNGTVTLPVVTGLTFTVGDGTTDATMTFTGTIANVNLRLGGLVFAPTTDFNGEATLQIVTNDQGFTGTGGPLSDTDSVTVTVNARGIFTDNVDIGAPGVAGSSSYSASTYTVAGGGADISGTGDQFQYLYRAITGDGRLTARLASQTGTDTRARAGVMFRESTAAGSSHGTFDITSASGWEFLSRPGNGLTTNSLQGTGIAAPYWMRLTRVGNSITAEWSANGTAWTALAQGPQTVAMASTIDVGLAVNAHNNASLNTAV